MKITLRFSCMAFLFFTALTTMASEAPQVDYPYVPVLFTQVHIEDDFWKPKLQTNRRVSIPYAFKMNEETGRLDNFRKAAGLMEGPSIGRRFNDTDIYKAIEGAAYHLAIESDPELEKSLDEMIEIVAGAQEPDGYLFTGRTIDPNNPAPGSGPERWSRLNGSHELYNSGHMFEAAAAYYQATGKRKLLDVAVKNADLLCRVFGPDGRKDAPGHQEIEIGLVKLYRVTGKKKYLDLAKFFLDQRGYPHDTQDYEEGVPFTMYNDRPYRQDHKPVIEQDEAVGHAVRAGYMYAGMADVAALTGDEKYIHAIDRLWANVVGKKLYLTGGIGSDGRIEGFGENYHLPNASAYCETCAAIGNAFWNERLFLLHGETRYLDVLERIVYNGLISGVSLKGDRFLYQNPLEVDNRRRNQDSDAREAWFEVACCPANLTRFLPSFPGYIYARRGDALYVNFFVGSRVDLNLAGHKVTLSQKTNYPWEGDVKLTLQPEKPHEFTVFIRIPGWAINEPVPSDLYRYTDENPEVPILKVNGETIALELVGGFAKIHRRWNQGDTVELYLPMSIRRVLAHENVEADRNKVAIERGPLVYCVEGVDNNDKVLDLNLPDNMILQAEYKPDLLGGVTVIKASGGSKGFVAIPYFAWGNRGANEMKVWFNRPMESARDYPIQPVPFTAVQVEDEFWAPRIETNRIVTIPFAFRQNEETGRVDNFRIAGGLMEGQYNGERYNDTDVYKVIEGAAYSLKQHPDSELEKYIDGLVDIIAKAQEPDGYLFTSRTCDPNNPAPGTGDTRWSWLAVSHELYDVGHMYEAAVAYYQATGKRKLLDVAIKNADLVERTFGPGPDKRAGTPGHQEIEIGLVKLYRITGEEKYLRLAQYFLDARGKVEDYIKIHPRNSRWSIYNDPVQIQAHKPILEQQEAVGHAVRAGYMYSGLADVAALTGNAEYIRVIDRLWDNVVGRRIYLTGGVGARHSHESFGEDYELPNLTAYNETCAAIANVFWNARLFLLHGHVKYIDVLERTAYNGLLSGVSLSGDRFFYPNPLASDGRYRFNKGSAERAPWFGVACCPGNVTRFLPSFPGYIYAVQDNVLYVNLFVAGRAGIQMNDQKVTVLQETRYPWDGDVKISLEPQTAGEFTLALRIPGWARGEAIPGELYRFLDRIEAEPTLRVNDQEIKLEIKDGFACIRRLWTQGDVVKLEMPMPVLRVVASDKVKADLGRVALQRGPLVYCAEWPDQSGRSVLNLILPDDTELESSWRGGLLNGVTVLTGHVQALQADGILKEQDFTAIPYYAWANRGPGEMAVWLARNREALSNIESADNEQIE